jgi:hypothetical protein
LWHSTSSRFSPKCQFETDYSFLVGNSLKIIWDSSDTSWQPHISVSTTSSRNKQTESPVSSLEYWGRQPFAELPTSQVATSSTLMLRKHFDLMVGKSWRTFSNNWTSWTTIFVHHGDWDNLPPTSLYIFNYQML